MDQSSSAWRPLTPRGVAVFARASLGRLLLVQVVMALLVASTVVWFLSTCWFATISAAIEGLPELGAIKAGRLNWVGESPRLLAENRFLEFAVDLNHSGQARSPSHVQVEFGQTDLRIYSLFGLLQAPYPKSYGMAFNRQELKPWWGAWSPICLAIAAAGVVLGLLTIWAILATLYCLPAWLLGLYLNRGLTLFGAWRQAGAALMPGALIMTAAIGLYGMGQLDVVRLIAAAALHILVGWLYLVLSSIAAPKLQSGLDPKVNPFATGTLDSDKTGKTPAKLESLNPFRPRSD